jgi:hypothetical protein
MWCVVPSMTMRMRVGCVALLAFPWSAPAAEAASKLCAFEVKPAGAWLFEGPPPIDVPENPRFVIDRGRLGDDFRVELARRDDDGAIHVRTAEVSIAPLDERTHVVTVHAEAGDWIPDPGFAGHGYCTAARAFRVVQDWRAAKLPPAVAVREDDILLRPTTDGEALSWTRLEWAYTEEALAADLHESEGFDRSWPHPVPGTAIAVRLVRHWPDGTSTAVRQMLAGSAPPASTCEDPRPPRAVPAGAVFLVEGRYAAFTTAGRRLPLRAARDEDNGHMRVTVEAPAGTPFALRALPLVNDCPAAQPLIVLGDGWRDAAPTIAGVFPVAEMPDQPARWPDFPMELRVEHADTWGLVEVAWGATYDEMESADGAHRDRVPADWLYFFRPRLPENLHVLYVRVTPLWPGGARGASWTGRLAVDPFTRVVTLKTVAAPRRSPALKCGYRAVGEDMAGLREAAPGLLLLVLLVFWGALRSRRPRHTSAPPPG